MSAWGAFRRRVHGGVLGWVVSSTGLAAAQVGALGYLAPAAREAEIRLPDHDAAAAVTPPNTNS